MRARLWMIGLLCVLGLIEAAQGASITITSGSALAFGTLIPGGSAGTAVISPAGARTTTIVVAFGAAAFNAASFDVNISAGNKSYTIILPGAVTLTGSNGGSMTLDTFVTNPSGGATVDAAGNSSFTAGATLHVGASQTAGTYTGSFLMTVTHSGPPSNTASVMVNVTARIFTPIAMAWAADMNFGDVLPGGAIGTVVLTPAGVRNTTGGVTLGNGTSVSAARFAVSGEPSATYSITLPGSVNITSGANSMTLNAFTSTPSGTGALSAVGSQTLSVGATLNVGIGQATGTYSNTFTVTVTYN